MLFVKVIIVKIFETKKYKEPSKVKFPYVVHIQLQANVRGEIYVKDLEGVKAVFADYIPKFKVIKR